MCPAIIEALAPEVPVGRRFESYVASQRLKLEGELRYWREGAFEVDFIYDRGKIFAIEVKSGKKKHSASLGKFLEKSPNAQPTSLTIKMSIDSCNWCGEAKASVCIGHNECSA